MFQVSPIPAFTDNYIWMLHDQNNDAIVVDPGDASSVVKALKESGKKLSAILITHHHSDHTGGVNELVDLFKVPVYGPKNSPFKGITHSLENGNTLTVLGHQFTIKEVPGHTLDHICYFHQDSASANIFCGDSLFLAGCGRVFEGSMEQMLSAMNYFKQLPEHTNVYCTHEYSLSNLAFSKAVEPSNTEIMTAITRCEALREKNLPTLPTNIQTELLINPFLRCDISSVAQSANKFKNTITNNSLDVFTILRNWKNNF